MASEHLIFHVEQTLAEQEIERILARYAYDRMHNSRLPLSDVVIVITHKYSLPLFSLMTDTKTSFWTPRTVAVVIGVVLLVVLLAYLVSLPQNKYHPCDLLEPTYAGDAELGYWMVYEYDPEVDVYHLLVVMQHDNGTFEWLDGDGIWLPRRAVEGTFTVIGSFDARKANL